MKRTPFLLLSTLLFTRLVFGNLAIPQLLDVPAFKGHSPYNGPQQWGLLVQYQSQNIKKQLVKQDLKSKFTVKKSFLSQNTDWLIPKKNAHDETFLKSACTELKRMNGVQDCLINRKLFVSANRHRRAFGKTLNQLRARIRTTSAINQSGLVALNDGSLTAFWAQEMVGIPEVQSFLKTKKPIQKASVAVIDNAFNYRHFTGPKDLQLSTIQKRSPNYLSNTVAHGTLVTNLINGVVKLENSTVQLGTAPSIAISYIHASEWVSDLYESKENLSKLNRKWIINYSLSLNSEITPVITNLKSGNVIVQAAGNHYPNSLNSYNIENSILVGSIEPQGYVSGFSQEGSALTVVAPGGDTIVSVDQKGSLSFFGGTSAATSLVTGALANAAVYFLPELSQKEANWLLKKTSIPIVYSMNKHNRNNYGLLNAYKLIRVAHRIHLQKKGKLFAKPNAAMASLDPKLFDFREEAKELWTLGQNLWNEGSAKNDRAKKVLGIESIRKSFFLSADRNSLTRPSETFAKSRDFLSRIYQAKGFVLNARFFENLNPQTLEKNLKERLSQSNRYSSWEMLSLLRTAEKLGKKGTTFPKPVLKQMYLQSGDSPKTKVALIRALSHQPDSVDYLKKVFLSKNTGAFLYPYLYQSFSLLSMHSSNTGKKASILFERLKKRRDFASTVKKPTNPAANKMTYIVSF